MRKCHCCKVALPDSKFEILDFPLCGECRRDWPNLLNGMQRSRRKDLCSACGSRARHMVSICTSCAEMVNIKAEAKPEQVIAPPSQISDIEVWMNQAIKLAEFARQQGMDEPEHQAMVINKIGPNPVMLDDELYLRKLLSNKYIDQKRKAEIQALLKAAPQMLTAPPVEIQMPSPPAPGTLEWMLSPPPPLPQSEIDKINHHNELSYAPGPEANGQIPALAKPKRRF